MREVCKTNILNISKTTLSHLQEIEEVAFSEELQDYDKCSAFEDVEDCYDYDADLTTVVYGKDWYILYSEKKDSIELIELASKEAKKGEKSKQLKEIMFQLRKLVETGKRVDAYMKEDTSYPLYLIFKNRGIIQQIGSDRVGNLSGFKKRRYSEKRQQEFLRNFTKESLDLRNHKIRMHQVSFKISESYVLKRKNIEIEYNTHSYSKRKNMFYYKRLL